MIMCEAFRTPELIKTDSEFTSQENAVNNEFSSINPHMIPSQNQYSFKDYENISK